MTAEVDVLTLAMKRVVTAVRSIAFEACSDPDELAKWWGPDGFTVPSLEFRPRVGRRYRIKMQPPEGDAFYLVGKFTRVDAPTVLAYTFTWEDPDPDDVQTQVVLSFRELGDATEISLTQHPFMTEARRSLHHDGWADSFAKLQGILSGEP